DVMNILQSEQTFQKATILVKVRKYAEAIQMLDESLELNPDEAEFKIWKAWCLFLVADPNAKKKVQAESAAVMEAALKKNPKCMPGYLFLGQMAKLAGDAAAAERHFKRGLQQEPDHQDIQRELKYLKK